MNRNIWKIIRTAQVAVVALLLTVSCTKDPTDGGGSDQEYTDFTIELQPPGYTPAKSRAMTDDQQNAIHSARVDIFDNQSMLVRSENVAVTGNKLTMTLKTSQNESDLYSIAVFGNPPVPFSTTQSLPGKWTGTEFMMFGDRARVYIKPSDNHLKIKMLRSLARIDVGVGTYDPITDTWSGLPDFVLSEVRVVNRRDGFAIASNQKFHEADEEPIVTEPTIHGNTVGKTAADALRYQSEYVQKGTTTGKGAYINSSIFVAETTKYVDDRLALIVIGTYKGAPACYRVDMCVPKGEGFDYLHVLRNHRYRITITNIGPGEADAEEALNSDPINKWVTLEPIPESDDGGDILADGYNYIETDVSEVQIYGKPDGSKEYNIFTVKAGSKAGALTTGTVTGPGIPGGSLALTNGVPQLVTVRIPAGAGPHTYTITLGALRKTIQVTVQKPLGSNSTTLPFTEVISITTEGGSDWLTLSHNATYVKDEQQSDFIYGNAQGKAYMHLADLLTDSGTFTAKAIVKHNDSRGATRIILERVAISTIGYFGGDPANTMTGEGTMYPKRLALAPLSTDTAKEYKKSSTANAASIINSIYYGRNMNVQAAALKGSETLSTYPAFEYCARLNEDTNKNGIIDDAEMVWYLPSQAQLMAVCIFINGIDPNETLYSSRYYISATETNARTGAWYFYPPIGGYNSIIDYYTHKGSYALRCVRDV